jgi:hypothetical protein
LGPAYEFPVILDLHTGTIHYSEKSPWTVWTGRYYWDLLRQTAVKVLGSAELSDSVTLASNSTPSTPLLLISPEEQLRNRLMEDAIPWVSFPQFYRWQYWARFISVMMLSSAAFDLTLGWSFGLFVIGFFCGLIAISPYWDSARRLILKIVGAKDTPCLLNRQQMVRWRVMALVYAVGGVLLFYAGIKLLLVSGFSGQNVFLAN